MVGTVSRTARVSGVTRNLKEAAGKTPRRPYEAESEIAYEGVSGTLPGEKIHGTVLRSPITIREGVSVYACGAIWKQTALMFGRSQQKPYELD
jgi:hypothetical protein